MLAHTSLVVLPALPLPLPLVHPLFVHHPKGILGQASKLTAKATLPASESWHWPLSLELRLLLAYPVCHHLEWRHCDLLNHRHFLIHVQVLICKLFRLSYSHLPS